VLPSEPGLTFGAERQGVKNNNSDNSRKGVFLMRHWLSFAYIWSITIGLILTTGLCEADSAAKSKSFTVSVSGTLVTVPLDVDSDSCGSTAPFVCTDLSGYTNYSGKVTGGGSVAGPFTGQSVGEIAPVAGTGCSINPTGQKACTVGAATDACAYTYEGGSFANQKSATGDLFFGSITPGGSECINFDSSGSFALPYPVVATINGTIAGGTGKLTGTTGTFTETVSGQILSIDLQGHDFGWFTATIKGTTP
jgi:hypothetical protein